MAKRKPRARSKTKATLRSRVPRNVAASLLSVNGDLKEMTYVPGEEEGRSIGYNPVAIGRPLVVRYLYFSLNLPGANNRNDEEVMVSTFVKTAEEKQGAAEAINYYNPKTPFDKGICRVTDFGGKNYGHELCYYTKSYLGESIKLTTKIMELDNLEVKLNAIADGINNVSAMPIFVEYLPSLAAAKAATSLIVKILKLLDQDDPIVPGHDLDMFFKRNHARRLQSGRVVCVIGKTDQQVKNAYRLDHQNRLIRKSDGKEYTETSYYVLQVNSEYNRMYEGFEYYQHAAELLGKTNRGGNLQSFVSTLVSGLESYGDIGIIDQVQELQYSMADPDVRTRATALFNLLSPKMKSIYRAAFERMLET